jgi:2-polyprenyl-6-methoxyphenol hydroxylase-like FAD-dependent oxidoreductase
MAQRGSLDSARIYLMIQSVSKEWLQEQGIAGLELDPEAFKRKLLHSDGHFATWGEQIKELIAAGCDAAISYPSIAPISAKPLYMLPIGHTWSHRRNLTLIGDAAHLATPFAGEGVNAAMLDALELANQLVPALQSSGDTDDTIKAFEAMMFPRAEVVEQETYQNLEIIFNDDDAPMAFVRFMRSMGGDQGQ